MLKRKMNEEDGNEDEDTGNFLMPFKKRIVKTQYTFNLDEGIGPAVKYRNLVNTLLEAEEGDSVRLLVNTPGGRLDSTISIIQNLKETAADTMAIVTGEAYSAGSAIVLACQQVAVLPGSSFLIHSASFGYAGKAKDVSDYVCFSEKQIRRFIETSYEHFLSKAEIERVLEGKELWMDSDEIIERLKSRQLIQEKEMQADLKRLNKEQKVIEAEIKRRSAPAQPKSAKKAPKKPKVAYKAKKASASAFNEQNAAEALV